MKGLMSLIVVLLLLVSLGHPQVVRNAKIGGQTVVRRAQAGGGETNFINDTFTEASDVNLTAHTPELGGTWVDHTDSAYPDTVTVVSASDRAAPTSGNGSMYYNDATPPSADYCCEAVMKVATIVSANAAIVLRMDTAANTGYIFQINNGTGWRFRKIVTGTQTTIGVEDTTTNIPSVGDTRTMKACAIGTALTGYINGAQLGTVGGTDSAITSAGKAGMRFIGAASTTTGYHFESFRCFTP